MNLGEKLKNIQNELKRKEEAAELLLKEKQDKEIAAKNEAISRFVSDVIEDISEKIQQGIVPKEYRIPKNKFFNDIGISGLSEFFDWASSNGLEGKFDYRHDGVGHSSWNVVYVVSKDS